MTDKEKIEDLHEALRVAKQALDIADGYEEFEIDGEMVDRYLMLDQIEYALLLKA